MYYFSYISMGYTCKNTLYKAVYALLASKERMIIPADEIETFKSGIEKDIDALNKRFARCNPIKPVWNTKYHSNDFQLWMGANVVCTFNLYTSQKNINQKSSS